MELQAPKCSETHVLNSFVFSLVFYCSLGLLWFSFGFLLLSLCRPLVFLLFYCVFPLASLWCSFGFPDVLLSLFTRFPLCFPVVLYCFYYGIIFGLSLFFLIFSFSFQCFFLRSHLVSYCCPLAFLLLSFGLPFAFLIDLFCFFLLLFLLLLFGLLRF